MTFLCIDPGWYNLGIVLLSKNKIIYQETYDICAGQKLATIKKIREWRNFVIKRLKRKFDLILSDYWEYFIDPPLLLVEKQMGDNEIWLTGVIQGLLQDTCQIGFMYRSMDCCAYYKIPVSKAKIKREEKKEKTVALVKEKGYNIETDHVADAIMLYLYHNKI